MAITAHLCVFGNLFWLFMTHLGKINKMSREYLHGDVPIVPLLAKIVILHHARKSEVKIGAANRVRNCIFEKG